jgi:4-hydroxy-2-oxoheptanedioate aldolase
LHPHHHHHHPPAIIYNKVCEHPNITPTRPYETNTMSDSSDVKPITDGGSDVPAGADVASYRAKTLFQPHRARQALRDAHEGKIPPLIAFICLLSSPQVIKVAAQLGFDIVMIDQEHSAMNIETMTDVSNSCKISLPKSTMNTRAKANEQQMVHNIQFMSEGKSMAWVR